MLNYIAIALALLVNPKIPILDDSTSSVDKEMVVSCGIVVVGILRGAKDDKSFQMLKGDAFLTPSNPHG